MKLFIQELKKLLLIFAADPRPLAAGIIAPSIILIAFTLIFGNLTSLPVSFVNNDSGSYSILLEKTIFSTISPLGNVPYFRSIHVSSEAEALELFTEGSIVAVITVPKDFSERIENHDYPEIDYFINNYNSDFGKNLRLYLYEGLYSFYNLIYPETIIPVEEIFTAGVQVNWVNIIASGALLLAGILGGLFLYLYLFFKEKQYGTLLFYSITPKSISSSFLARVVLSILFSILTSSFNMLLALLLTGQNFFTVWIFLLLPIVLTSIAYISISAILSLIMKNFYSAAMSSMFGAVLVWFISGGMSGVSAPLTQVNGIISLIFPNRYAFNIITRKVFTGEADFNLSDWVYLILISVFFFLLSYILHNRMIWKPHKDSRN